MFVLPCHLYLSSLKLYVIFAAQSVFIHIHWTMSKKSAHGERLWTIRSTQSGPKIVPWQLYNTQDFELWLGFFLSHPGIEDQLDLSYQYHQSDPEVFFFFFFIYHFIVPRAEPYDGLHLHRNLRI
jgi:hypothetical protein